MVESEGDGLAIDCVVLPDLAVDYDRPASAGKDGRTSAQWHTLDDVVAVFNPSARISGQMIISVRPGATPAHSMPPPAICPPRRQLAEETISMKAIVVTDQAAGAAGM